MGDKSRTTEPQGNVVIAGDIYYCDDPFESSDPHHLERCLVIQFESPQALKAAAAAGTVAFTVFGEKA